MAKKRFKMRGNVWQLVGLGLLALVTLGVVAYALVPAPAPASVAVPTAKPSATKTAAPKTVVAFIGDSYTSGTGATVPTKRWSTLLSSSMGWTEANLGKGGTGYFNAGTSANYKGSIQQAVDAKPSIVVVSGGRNDVGYGYDRFAPAVADFFATLRAALPKAKIIVTSPIYDDDAGPAAVADLAASVKADAEQAGASYVDIGEPLLGHADFVAADGVHPNDAGHAAIYTAVKQAVEAVPGMKQG